VNGVAGTGLAPEDLRRSEVFRLPWVSSFRRTDGRMGGGGEKERDAGGERRGRGTWEEERGREELKTEN